MEVSAALNCRTVLKSKTAVLFTFFYFLFNFAFKFAESCFFDTIHFIPAASYHTVSHKETFKSRFSLNSKFLILRKKFKTNHRIRFCSR